MLAMNPRCHSSSSLPTVKSSISILSSPIFGKVRTDGQTESDAYEPIVQVAQVGSKMFHLDYV